MKRGTWLLATSLLLGSAALAADEGRLTTMNGTVVSADKGGSMLVKVDQGQGRTEDVTIVVPPDAKIIKAGRKIALEDVAGGEKVTVNYKTVDGKKTAVSIGVESTA